MLMLLPVSAQTYTLRLMSRPAKTPKQSSKSSKLPIVVAILIVFAGLIGVWFLIMNSIEEEPKEQTSDSEIEEFDRSQHSIDDSSSIWVITNKQRPLQPGYTPEELVNPDIPLYGPRDAENMLVDARITNDLEQLVREAEEEGLNIALGSGYRSESYQRGIYNNYVEQHGEEEADRFSARPRHSEHQTGLAVDFVRPDGECSFQACFADLPEGEWLIENAYRYGFILRYQENTEDIVGYQYEPWHFRYVGRELAEELHAQGKPTLEEFFDLSPAPDYEG